MKNHILQIEKKLRTTKKLLLQDSILQNDIDFSHDFILPYSKADKTSNIKLIFIGQDPTVRREESREEINVTLNLDKGNSLRTYLEKVCETLGMDLEKSRLSKAGRNDLANKIERVSLTSDSYGYDIISFDDDGTKRYIEVKATRSNVGVANFFFTANELRAAQETKNYYNYMVYEVTTDEPKVWAIKNPFNPENENAIKTPINYRITINSKSTTN